MLIFSLLAIKAEFIEGIHYISPKSLGWRGLIWIVFHRLVLYTLSRPTPSTKYIYPLLLILRVHKYYRRVG